MYEDKFHDLKRQHGVLICNKCGAALHDDGYWYLGGRMSDIAPPCLQGGNQAFMEWSEEDADDLF